VTSTLLVHTDQGEPPAVIVVEHRELFARAITAAAVPLGWWLYGL
jgi:hypothetical protein